MNTSPQRIAPDYKPSARVFELAEECGIQSDFVKKQIPEFIFYFQEKGTRRAGWDRTCWSWIKRSWEWKEEKRKKATRTHPQSSKEWIAPVIKVAKSRPKLKDLLRIANGG